MKSDALRRPSILTDHETKVDLLNNEAIASTIISLLREHADRPVTIGVHGDWGAGKSSVLEMIEGALGNDGDVLCLKFNGWRFQGFEDAKIALIEGIVTGLLEKRPALTKATGAIKEVLKRVDWMKVAKKSGGLAFTAMTGIPSPDQIGGIVGVLKGMLEDPAELATKENISSAIEHVNSVLKPAESKNIPEEIEGFRKAFAKLLVEAGIKQLVVLIDDLDRCLPDTAIETLEAIRLFVFSPQTAFVVAADEAMIEYAVRKHFPDLPDSTGPRDYARNYLEKLIQVPFRIPPLGETETRIYVALLLAGAELGERDPAFDKLVQVARVRLRRPWESAPLDAAAARDALGDKADQANNALVLSDQIGPILAGGTKGNPRQIKRFLNALLLRTRTAQARGFGDEIKLPVMAKLMLAERFLPSLFEQVAITAVTDPQGQCGDLLKLETSIAAKETISATPPAREADDPAEKDSAILAEWKVSESILAWASVHPPMGGLDLRPYLFATKDKKDFFGPASALGHLAGVVERLLGNKLAVQGQEGDLRLLARPEAEKVFDAVRSRLLAGDSFTAQPDGIEGLKVLVKAQPTLQGRLLELLAALPAERCGPWMVAGWQGVLRDPDAQARLQRMVEKWSTISGNSALSAAATGVMKTPRGGR